MGKVLHTPMDIFRFIYIYMYANCDHSVRMHADLEIQVPT